MQTSSWPASRGSDGPRGHRRAAGSGLAGFPTTGADGLHTGEPDLIGDAYIGIDVNRTARICSAGHGGQILVSQTTRDLVSTAVQFRDLGTYLLAGVEQAERIFEVRAPGLRSASLPLRAEHESGVHGRRRPGRGCGGARPRPSSPRHRLAGAGADRARPAARGAHQPRSRAVRRRSRRAPGRRAAREDRPPPHRPQVGRAASVVLVSAPVAELAAGTDAKLACLDRLGEDRQVVSEIGAEAAALLDRSFTAHAVRADLRAAGARHGYAGRADHGHIARA